jgi:hypothetical protein
MIKKFEDFRFAAKRQHIINKKFENITLDQMEEIQVNDRVTEVRLNPQLYGFVEKVEDGFEIKWYYQDEFQGKRLYKNQAHAKERLVEILSKIFYHI